MNIKLSQVHIENLRSIKQAGVNLCPFTVLFGMNDSGKSNFLFALRLAFSNINIDEKDVFRSQETPFSISSSVIVDLKFVPQSDSGEQIKSFNELWALHLGDNVMIDDDDKEFFAFRTTFTYDTAKEEYVRTRSVITKWQDEEIIAEKAIGYKTLSAFEFVYIDAQRDMALDIRDRNSLWNKQISKLKLSVDAKSEIETSLEALSNRIMEESPFLQQVSHDLAAATNANNSIVEINPITRSVDELYKGLDISVKQDSSVSIPISNLGLGTRSRAVFASLKTIINSKISNATETPYFCLVAFEEPESHVHPHSQRRLVKQFSDIQGQRVITTHSPYVLSSSQINDLVYVCLQRAESRFSLMSNLELEAEELRHIERFVVNTRGELLFSNIVILAEGETEEQALPVFFKEFFGYEPFELGVSFVGVGGKNYLPFLRMLKSMDIDWFVFSDGESAAINDLRTTLKKLFVLPTKPTLDEYDNIIVLENSSDYEKYLLDAGYADEIITAINAYEDAGDEHQESYFDNFIRTQHGTSMPPKSTGKKCDTCGQTIKEGGSRDYCSDDGRIRAICDCMKSGKTRYAVPISKMICSTCDDTRKYPPKIKSLFEQIRARMEVSL